MWDAAKSILRGKFIAINTHITKQERFQINNLIAQLKGLDEEEQTELQSGEGRKWRLSRSKWLENGKTMEKINQTKNWFFEKISKIDRPVARLMQNER